MSTIAWHHLQTKITSHAYVCGYCGSDIASQAGWAGACQKSASSQASDVYIMICHRCSCPTFFDWQGNQMPAVAYGKHVSDVTDDSVKKLYDEARQSTGAGCYTSAVMCCRKLLMHIAVAKGAKEGLSFLDYVQYICDKGYVPPDARDWVNHIRDKGNEANHEIRIMPKNDAEDLVSFVEMILRLIYEFPAQVKRKTAATKPAPAVAP